MLLDDGWMDADFKKFHSADDSLSLCNMNLVFFYMQSSNGCTWTYRDTMRKYIHHLASFAFQTVLWFVPNVNIVHHKLDLEGAGALCDCVYDRIL